MIDTLYNDPKVGLTGINDFSRKLKENGQRVSDSTIKKYLEQHEGYSKHKQVKKQPQKRRFYSPAVDTIWQADIAYFTEYPEENDGYMYWLVCVDTFSKYCWVIPLKNKSMKSTSQAFEGILSQRKPECLNTDSGTEFVGKQFQAVLKKHNIHWYASKNEGKAMIAERLIGTFKRKLGLYMTTYETDRWLDALPDLVFNYNHNTVHTSTKFKPIDATLKKNHAKVYLNLYLKKNKATTPKFKVGDSVRIYAWKDAFAKSFKQTFTDELFTVSEIVLTSNGNPTKPPTYKLKDYDGEPIQGSFYENELVKFIPQTNEYEIETVIQKKGNKCLVKWKGYPHSMNSWVECNTIKKHS